MNAGTILISNGSPVKIYVPTNDIGNGWRAPSFDDASWSNGTTGVGYEAQALEYAGLVIADSAGEWSAGGKQGANSWINGFYDKTADPAGIYTTEKFQPFRRSNDPWGTNNFWDGGSWNWFPNDVPWDNISTTFIHPNGTNSGGLEHWSIRRWRSTVAGQVTLQFLLRKSAGGGNGVTGKIFKNGEEILTRAIAGSDQTGFNVLVPTALAVGDYLDFVQTPVGLDSDGNDGSDGSEMTARVLSGTLVAPVAATDTISGWVDGAQGGNNWYYGFWNKTADADGIYTPATDFNNTDPNWTLAGGSWNLGPGDPPWDNIGQTTWHPNGDNQPQGIHWVIKRWVATADGDYNCRVQFAKDNPSGGGTTLHVMHNGTDLGHFTIAGNDAKGIDTFVLIPAVLAGDFIEFALDPTGTDASADDPCDGSKLVASVYASATPWIPSLRPLIATDVQNMLKDVSSSVYLRIPFTVANTANVETLTLKLKWNDGFVAYLNGTLVANKNTPTVISGTVIADSTNDWSTTGMQGNNGWFYGYYNKTLDLDGTYADSDFTMFPHDGGGYSPTDFWNGSGYDWYNGNPPWTELYQENVHPNSPHNDSPIPEGFNEHWVIRRWVAQVDSATLKCRFKFHKNNVSCGDGIVGLIFVKGAMVYSNSITGGDAVGRDDVVDLPEVLIGDNVDIVIAPGGNDGCDGSAFSAVIFEGTPSIPWDAAATARRTASGASGSPDSIDLTAFIPRLNNGLNLLAIQGINISSNDADVLIVPELIANRVPVATNDAITVIGGTTTLIPGSTLLANDVDSDGETPVIVGVTPSGVTPAGGGVQLMGQTVHYTAPAGFAGADSFVYTITDISGTPVQATVDVTVASSRIESIQPAVGGGYKVVFPGVAGITYSLVRSPVLPATTWTTVAGPIVPTVTGPLELTDPTPPPGQAFYRVSITQ